MNKLLILVTAIFLSACASQNQPPLKIANFSTAEITPKLTQDLRPPDEKKVEVFSYLISSERYGIFRIGDVTTEPSALDLLQLRIQEHIGSQTPVQIKVNHFVVYKNMQGSLRAGAFGALLGPLGAVVATKSAEHSLSGNVAVVDPILFTNTSGDNEWKRGLSDARENPENGPTLITWLDVEINGKRFFLRGVSPLKVPEGQIPYAIALEALYAHLLKQI